jgi:hypothetical protein
MVRLLRTRWKDLRVDDGSSLFPGKRPGRWVRVPFDCAGGEALKVLWDYARGSEKLATGPIIPAAPCGSTALPLVHLRERITKIRDLARVNQGAPADCNGDGGEVDDEGAGGRFDLDGGRRGDEGGGGGSREDNGARGGEGAGGRGEGLHVLPSSETPTGTH